MNPKGFPLYLLFCAGLLLLLLDAWEFVSSGGPGYWVQLVRGAGVNLAVWFGLVVVAGGGLVWVYATRSMEVRRRMDGWLWGIGNLLLTGLSLGILYLAVWALVLYERMKALGLGIRVTSLRGWLNTPAGILVLWLLVTAGVVWSWLALRSYWRRHRGH